jgi:Sec-independent protein secretion pathway component TatC
MKRWHRALVWLLLLIVAAIIVPGVDPYTPLLLGVVLIATFELSQRRLLPLLRRRR